MLLLGLTIQYWYVALPIVAIVVVAAISNARAQRKKAAHKPGPRDPWLNEVAVALADLGLKEIARNTGAQLGGAPIDGDIGLEAERFLVYVTLFSDQRLARQAAARATGQTGGAGRDRQGRDRGPDSRPGRIRGQRPGDCRRRVPPRRGRSRRRRGWPCRLRFNRRRPHHVRALPRRLRVPTCWNSSGSSANCGTAGVLTDAEFEAKKAELLGRL